MKLKNKRPAIRLIPCQPAFIAVLCTFVLVGKAYAYDGAECIACHGHKDGKSRLTMDLAAFKASVHNGQAECGDCHGQVVDESHIHTPGSGTVDCSQCHDTINAHGAGGAARARPNCAACHSRHGIRAASDPDSTVNPGNLSETCGGCHQAQTSRTDYLSFLPATRIRSHPKENFGKSYSRDNCIGCHQGRAAHGQNTIIDETDQCRRCHMDAEGNSALMGVIHARADLAKQPGIFAAGVIYQLILLALLATGGNYIVTRISRRFQSRGEQTGGYRI